MDVVKPKINDAQYNWIYFFGLSLAIIIIISTIILWRKLHENETLHIQREVTAATQVISQAIQNKLSDHINILMRMSLRWNILNGTPKEAWEGDATSIYQNTKIYESFMLIDTALKTRWVIPLAYQFHPDNPNQFYKELQTIVNQVKPNGFSATSIFNFDHNKKGFLLIVPIFDKHFLQGYIAGLINIEKMFNQIFNKTIIEEYNIAIYQNNALVFNGINNNAYANFSSVDKFFIGGTEWKIVVWPTKLLINKIASVLAEIILIFGIIISLLTLIVFYFFISARKHFKKAREASILSEKNAERLQAVLDNVNEGFISYNAKGVITFWNLYAERIFGWRADQVVGKDFFDIIIPKRFREEHRMMSSTFLQKTSEKFNQEIEFIAQTKDGKEFPVEVVTFLLHEDGQINFYAFIRDISKRKEAETDQARLATLVNYSDDAILSTDCDGIITTWNNGAEKLTGFSAKEMVGQSVALIYPESKQHEMLDYLKRLEQGEHVRNDDTLRRHRGGYDIPVSVSLSPIKNAKGEVIGISSIARDISERKKIDKMKNEFISIVSHELRTPLTSIRGSIGLLASEKIVELPAKAQQLLDIAINNCERLIRLINDILDIEKIESCKMKFQFKEIYLNQLIRDAVETNQGYATKQHVQLEFIPETNERVFADYDRLMQVMTNLLSNAIRFSPPNETVKIKVTKMLDKVRISVVDKGPGIPDNFKNKIFEKFSQADSSDTRKKGGTGLGLNISKSIIEKHGGRISFVSDKNTGTIFYFELARESQTLLNKDEKKEEKKDEIKVLICDHHLDSGDYLQKLLASKNITSDIAISTKLAKTLLEKNNYSAITVDLFMPDEDGISFIRDIRKNAKTKNTPIVVISMKQENTYELNGDAFLLIDWIKKPIDQHESEKILNYIDGQFINRVANILHVEDDFDTTELIRLILSEKANVQSAKTLTEARKLLNSKSFDVVILDLKLPDGSGTELLPCINAVTKKPIPVIVFSINELEKKYLHLVQKSLLKSRVTNDQLLNAITSAINLKD